MPAMNYKFIDKNKGANLKDGIEYFAVGLIVDSYIEDGKGSSSGKDYFVQFIDPWGNIHNEWRCIEEIEISKIDDADADLLRMAFARAENNY